MYLYMYLAMGVVFVAGIGLAIWRDRKLLQRWRSWPEATAEIISVIHTRTTGARHLPAFAVSYSYRVQGQSYSGELIRGGIDWEVVDRKAQKFGFTQGAKIAVYYDPDNPRRHTLFREANELVNTGLAGRILQAILVALIVVPVLYVAVAQLVRGL